MKFTHAGRETSPLPYGFPKAPVECFEKSLMVSQGHVTITCWSHSLL